MLAQAFSQKWPSRLLSRSVLFADSHQTVFDDEEIGLQDLFYSTSNYKNLCYWSPISSRFESISDIGGHDGAHEEPSSRLDYSQIPKWASRQSLTSFGLTSRTNFTSMLTLSWFEVAGYSCVCTALPYGSTQRRTITSAHPRVAESTMSPPMTQGSIDTPHVPD